MSAKILIHPAVRNTPAEDILVSLYLEMSGFVTCPPASELDTLFECQRCEWAGRYPPFALIPDEDCEFPHCPACGSWSVILVTTGVSHAPPAIPR